MHRKEALITYTHYLAAEACKKAVETGKIQVDWRGGTHDVLMGNETHSQMGTQKTT